MVIRSQEIIQVSSDNVVESLLSEINRFLSKLQLWWEDSSQEPQPRLEQKYVQELYNYIENNEFTLMDVLEKCDMYNTSECVIQQSVFKSIDTQLCDILINGSTQELEC